MEKKYELETIKQIKEIVTSKNIKMFLTDFEAWLTFNTELKEKAKLTGTKIQTNNSFIWVDDGKNNITLTIKSLENKREGKD